MTSTELATIGSGFTAAQRDMLQAPLNAEHVKERAQGGRNLSYIEGWKAIEEANRIFGFDAWTRETTEIKLVAEHARKIGKAPNQRDGWGVSYIAKVRVIVRAGTTPVIREGIGSGHGIDADCGLAHESAIKEAETDAMKRALMTFGNPFGLALYDKSHANVKRLPKANARGIYERLQAEMGELPTIKRLENWAIANEPLFLTLPEDWQAELTERYQEVHAALTKSLSSGGLADIQKDTAGPSQIPESGPADEDGVIWDDPPTETDAGQSKWAAMSPVQQAGIRCGEMAFWKFATAHMGKSVGNAAEAANYVRTVCNIKSRAQLSTDAKAAATWRKLDAEFIAWKHDPSPTSAWTAEQPAPSPALTIPATKESGAGDLSEDHAATLEMFRSGLRKAAERGTEAFRSAWTAIPREDKPALEALKDELKQKLGVR